jgi:general secretion pathway protein K
MRCGTKERAAAMIASKRGIALLMVLWVITILMVIVLSFSFMTRTETHATLYFKEGAEKKFIAEAGMQRSIMEMYYRGWYKGQSTTKEGSDVIKVDGTQYTGQLGTDYYTFGVLDESGKINLNLLTDNSGIILNNLLVNRGVPKEQADIIVDSVLDWMDGDELHRVHGAESEYYMSLPNPYKAKNDKFETVEELALVKGMTTEILYGNDRLPGIIDVLTVYAKAGAINLNAAPKEVIAALPGMTREAAEQIISLRTSTDLKDMDEVKQTVGDVFKQISTYVGLTESNTYSIEATGFKKGEKRGLSVKAVVEIQGAGQYRWIYYKSPAGTRQWQDQGLQLSTGMP